MLKSSKINIEKLHDMNLKSIADIKRSMNAALFSTNPPDCANNAVSKTQKPRAGGAFHSYIGTQTLGSRLCLRDVFFDLQCCIRQFCVICLGKESIQATAMIHSAQSS